MSTTSIGRKAEDAAAAYLVRKGYKIIDQNWRTRWCEIDIVASKDGCVSFVEVKYRRRDTWGSGLDYITPAKQRQMAFAVEFWIAQRNWGGTYCLAGVDVVGDDFVINKFVPEI